MNQSPLRPTVGGHLRIMRFDHWIKNVFVLPGIVVAASAVSNGWRDAHPLAVLGGLLSVGLIASSNYTINEVLDAPYDRRHPVKCSRPAACGLVNTRLAYVQWLLLFACGLAIAWRLSTPFAITMAALWVMGCIYNIPPVRSKDVAYLDVLTEAINNPLRLLAGWYIVAPALVPPASLLMSYWMVGCYFMAIKRFAEYREIGNAAISAAYRKSFAHYNERRLLVSIMFYASLSMLFFGSFIMRYRLELILAFPLVAWVMSQYLALAFKPNSGVQNPEYLYREPALMTAVVACSAAVVILLYVDIPAIYTFFTPLKNGLH